MSQVEIYVTKGVLCGELDPGRREAGRARVQADLEGPFSVDNARWYPIDGGPAERRGRVRVLADDVLVIVTTLPDVRVHSTWHPTKLEIGPYHVTGRLATPPGFDPDRALARPKSQFIGLRDVGIQLRDRPDATVAQRANALVNRYLVDRSEAPLMLSFYFPGAKTVVVEPEARTPLPVG
jgi:hypothetical protein